MKKLFTILIVFTVVFTVVFRGKLGLLYAQDTDNANNQTTNFVLKTNVTDLVFNSVFSSGAVYPLSLSLEIRLGDDFSLQANGNYTLIIAPNVPNTNAYGYGAEVRWYFTKKPALQGFYLSLLSDYSSYTRPESPMLYAIPNTSQEIGVGSLLGYQWIYEGLALDLFLGVRGGFSLDETSSSLTIPYGFSMGWAF